MRILLILWMVSIAWWGTKTYILPDNDISPQVPVETEAPPQEERSMLMSEAKITEGSSFPEPPAAVSGGMISKGIIPVPKLPDGTLAGVIKQNVSSGFLWKPSGVDNVQYIISEGSCLEVKGDRLLFLSEGTAVVTVLGTRNGVAFSQRYQFVVSGGTELATKVPSGFERDVLRYVNKFRKEHDLAPLVANDDLNAFAMKRADECSRHYSHERLDGEPYDDIKTAGYKIFGENIACGQPTAKVVVDNWINSPTHRKNLLTPEFKEMGIGCVYDTRTVNTGERLKNNPKEKRNARIYWAQIFRG